MKKYIAILMIFCVVISYAEVITTATGQGADTYIESNNPAANHGDAEYIVLKEREWGTARKGYLKFDISSLPNTTFTNVRLSLFSAGTFGTAYNDFTIGVYGIDDSAGLDGWDEATLNLYNAPAQDSSSNGFTADAEFLGNIIISKDSHTGDGYALANQAILDFINSDTDGLITIAVNIDTETNFQMTFATKETDIYSYPMLELEGFTTVEPKKDIAQGGILSYFDFGESEIWGMDISEQSWGTELHVLADVGQTYKVSIEDVSQVKDGSMWGYNAKTPMFANSLTFDLTGVAYVKTYQGSYGTQYVAIRSNRERYSVVWGDPDAPEYLSWLRTGNAYQLRFTGDITPSARVREEGQWPSLWGVFKDSEQQNWIYKYPNTVNAASGDFTTSFAMPKAMNGLSLGENDDLWVLCTDGEILRVSDSDGSILDRFYIDSSITSPYGIAYDINEDSLWISNKADGYIYQVATDILYASDLTLDGAVNQDDLELFMSQWLEQ